MIILIFSFVYKNFAKRILFLFDPEFVHEFIVSSAELLGKSKMITNLLSKLFNTNSSFLKQKIAGINFNNPIGLAAGFDYDAKLTQILYSIDFGFQTVGTITNFPYEGNPKPRLDRLPKSKSLMVNKGFKNKGAKEISEKLSKMNFKIPLGISIGVTNPGKSFKQRESSLGGQKSAIADILSAFKEFEDLSIKNSYYELNISCPNLMINVSFYPPKKLDELLIAVDKLNLKKPIFIKMPINETNNQTLKMLEIISKHKIKGVIFGNLQKDKTDKSLNKDEVKKFKKGNFSGKPTEKRSNELISLAYKNYGKKLIIIGCGGIFSAADAYKKIKLGATLVQLITGLIFEGPALIATINKELIELLKQDGYENISKAIGVDIN